MGRDWGDGESHALKIGANKPKKRSPPMPRKTSKPKPLLEIWSGSARVSMTLWRADECHSVHDGDLFALLESRVPVPELLNNLPVSKAVLGRLTVVQAARKPRGRGLEVRAMTLRLGEAERVALMSALEDAPRNVWYRVLAAASVVGNDPTKDKLHAKDRK